MSLQYTELQVRYTQLDYRKRCRIYGLWKSGHNQSEIAKELGVHKSTISREFKRNITFVRTSLGYWDYKPDYAQTYTDERHKRKHKAVKFTKSVKDFVLEKLRQDWSQDQISGYAKRHKIFNISHECIYRFILAFRTNNRLRLCLRFRASILTCCLCLLRNQYNNA